MKKNKGMVKTQRSEEDTMRPQYDFSNAVRGVTAARYAEGTNVVLLDPDVAEIFPIHVQSTKRCVQSHGWADRYQKNTAGNAQHNHRVEKVAADRASHPKRYAV
jgi:hypothetical protein